MQLKNEEGINNSFSHPFFLFDRRPRRFARYQKAVNSNVSRNRPSIVMLVVIS